MLHDKSLTAAAIEESRAVLRGLFGVRRAVSSSRRRFIVIGIALISAIIGVTAVLIWMQRNAAMAAYKTATVNLAQGMYQQTLQSIGSTDRMLAEVKAHLTSRPQMTQAQLKAGMRSHQMGDFLRQLIRVQSSLTALAIVDADGTLTNSGGEWSLQDDGLSRQDFFIHFKADNGQGAFISAPTLSKVSNTWVAFLARRIDDAQGRFAGLVVGEISLASLENFYRIAMPVRRSVIVSRPDGVILVRYPARNDEIGKKIPDGAAWYATVARGGGTYFAREFFTKARVLASVHPSKDLPIVVMASVNESDILVDWPLQILWLCLGAAAAIVTVVLLLRHLARQVRRLEKTQMWLGAKNDELSIERSRFDAALSNIALGVCLFDRDKKLIICNRGYREIYNLTSRQTEPGTSLAEIVNHRRAARSLPRGTPEEYLASHDAFAAGGERRQTLVELVSGRVILATRQPMANGGWVETHEDITERRKAENHIRFLAHHDVLTGLANRAMFAEKLDEAVARLKRHGEPFAVFMLDLDRFKNVNDTLGHLAGDLLLRETAQRLKSSLRETDVLARLGGDEFAIIQSGETDSHDAAANLAARILNIICRPYQINGDSVSVGTSIGIALSSQGSELLKMADVALYRAKASGRNCFSFFDAAMLTELEDRRQLENELRLAVARGELELHYQAIIEAKTRRPVGFEALLRWRSPTRGLVMPGEFVPLAEETGLIVPIGAWVLKRACADAATWPSHLKVAVNLSPVQLAKPDLLETVVAALAESSLPAERLECEITETALFRSDIDCLGLVRQLRRLGVSVALDDFGTGYSSLSYLTTIPFDRIKIDQSFTLNMLDRADCAAIVSAVVALGRDLKTQTVAEGVETERHLNALRAAGVTLVQGYLFGVPCPASDLTFDNPAADGIESAA